MAELAAKTQKKLLSPLIWGLGFRVRVLGLGFRVRVWGSGFSGFTLGSESSPSGLVLEFRV